MALDRTGLQVLPVEECLQLLARPAVHVGRVAFVVDGQPIILPVNYRLHEGSVLFRTDPGTKLHAVRRGQLVAFEVDTLDADWQEGWSVLVQGSAEELTDPAEIEAAARPSVWTWAPGDKAIYVRINPTQISGRRIV